MRSTISSHSQTLQTRSLIRSFLREFLIYRITSIQWNPIRFAGLAAAVMILMALRATAFAGNFGFSLDSASQDKGELEVLVLDEHTLEPLPDAEIITGSFLSYPRDRSEPWVKTHVRTDEEGRASLTAASAVTVIKTGYSRMSVVGVQGGEITFYLRPKYHGRPEAVVHGELTEWKKPSGFTSAMAGLVFESFSASDLLHLRSSKFISPLRDTINVLGERKIPSNVVIPEQDVFLPIGSIHLNKPLYRLPVRSEWPLQLTGIQVEFEVMDMLPVFSGGSGRIKALNKVKPKRIGLSREFQPSSERKEDFAATIDLAPRHRVSAPRSPFAADVLTAAFTDMDGDRQRMVPTDVKVHATKDSSKSAALQLSAPSGAVGASQGLVTLAMASGSQISGVISENPGKTISVQQFMDVGAGGEFVKLPAEVTLRSIPGGISTVSFHDGNRDLSWAVYALPAAGDVRVDTVALAEVEITQYVELVMEFGPGFNSNEIDGERLLKQLNRFTRRSFRRSKDQ